MKKRFIPRVGMRVRTDYNGPERVITLDKSTVGQRIFREKGTNYWYTKDELLPLDAPTTRSSTVSAKQVERAAKMRANAFRGMSGAGLELTKVLPRKRKCRQCGKPFRPKRPWQVFDLDACRTLHHKVSQSHKSLERRNDGKEGKQEQERQAEERQVRAATA